MNRPRRAILLTRVPLRIHRQVARLARLNGLSITSYINQAIDRFNAVVASNNGKIPYDAPAGTDPSR